MHASEIEILATSIFGIAILHTFLSSRFQSIAAKFPEGSILENLFHMLGEIEVIFGLWAAIFLAGFAIIINPTAAIKYAEGLNFTEPLFVFAIMTVAATKPIIIFARSIIFYIAKLIPVSREHSVYFTCMVIGPVLGSFITEPAAMTVTALILRDRYFKQNVSQRLKYVSLATLFVNVSIGGVLTPFAAPPVLMVASAWNWNIRYMFETFGWKAMIIAGVNAFIAVLILRRELISIGHRDNHTLGTGSLAPKWLIVIHLIFLGLIVVSAHHSLIFIGALLFFLGVATITKKYQDELLLKQSLLVAFFLGGLVILGNQQTWWLQPLLTHFSDKNVFFGATALTAVTDNAAITYLGSQLHNLTDSYKYALVAGAVAGGGLTVIANAPNPAGFAILQESFGPDGIHPVRLLVAAAIPTFIAVIVFGILWG